MVCHFHYGMRRPEILDHVDAVDVGISGLEGENVVDAGATESVESLVVVPDCGHRGGGTGGGEQLDQLFLSIVHVLVLIHDDVAELRAHRVEVVLVVLQPLDQDVDDAVEVGEVIRPSIGEVLVPAHDRGECPVIQILGFHPLLMHDVQGGGEAPHRFPVRLGPRRRTQTVQAETLVGVFPAGEIGSDQGGLADLVHDFPIAVFRRQFLEKPQTERVYGADIHVAERRVVGHLLFEVAADAGLELGRGVLGERESDDRFFRRALEDKARNAARHRFGLPATGAGNDQQVALAPIDRFLLSRRRPDHCKSLSRDRISRLSCTAAKDSRRLLDPTDGAVLLRFVSRAGQPVDDRCYRHCLGAFDGTGIGGPIAE